MDTKAPAGGEVIMAELIKEADKVAKKQKTCAAKTSGTLYKLVNTIHACIDQVTKASDAEMSDALQDLSTQIETLDAVLAISSDTKELHGSVSKLGKVVDKSFALDICGALRDVPMDKPTLDIAIAQHLYHEGLFEVGDTFVQEAGVVDHEELKAPYISMHAVLAELEKKNLQPAFHWAKAHQQQLLHPDGTPSDFEFSLHRLAFLQTLHTDGALHAMHYARKHFPTFQKSHLADMLRLMGALCCAQRIPSNKQCTQRYSELFAESLWEELTRDFKKQCCSLLGRAPNSPLLVSVAAGAAALPTLLKLASVIAKTQPTADGRGDESEQLPVEVPLGPEFVFHSIFACPVSREQNSAENPAMMLPCGHCICKQSILLIAKSSSRPFKCPYCPVEATTQQCMELHFPDRIER